MYDTAEYSSKLLISKVLLSIKFAKALLDRIRLNCYSRAAEIYSVYTGTEAVPNRLCSIQSLEHGIAIVLISGSTTVSRRQLLEALQRQITSLTGNGDIRGIILTGPVEGFCICSAERDFAPYEAAVLAGFGQQVMFSLEKVGKPCLAVIAGECSGLGLELALACDFIVAAHGASFGFPAIADGLIPCCGGTQRLARLVGKSKAKEMIYSGEMIDAGEALRSRLVNRLYAEGELLPKTQDLLAHICSRSPHAIRIGGEVVNAGYDIDLQTACLLERDAFALCFSSFDQREGMQAFLDKRQPQFRGE
jgi:enoyl-CoA hydratase